MNNLEEMNLLNNSKNENITSLPVKTHKTLIPQLNNISNFIDSKQHSERNKKELNLLSKMNFSNNLIKQNSNIQNLLHEFKHNFQRDSYDLKENLPFTKEMKGFNNKISRNTAIGNFDSPNFFNKKSAVIGCFNIDEMNKSHDKEMQNDSILLDNSEINKAIKNKKSTKNLFFNAPNKDYKNMLSISIRNEGLDNLKIGYNDFPNNVIPSLEEGYKSPNPDKLSENNLIKQEDDLCLIPDNKKDHSTHLKTKTLIDQDLEGFDKIDSENIPEIGRDLKKYKNVYDSFSYCEEINEYEYSNFLINPSGLFKQTWDKIMTFMVLYSIIISSYLICFLRKRGTLEIILEFIVDIVFIIDFGFNFITPFYDKEENLISNISDIVTNYLEHSLIFDLITCIPFSIISHLIILNQPIINDNLDPSVRYIVWLQWIRLIRVMKLEKRNSNSYHIEIDSIDDTRINRLLRYMIYFFLVIHLTSCFWIFIGRVNSEKNNWIQANELDDSNKFDIYVASLYFNMVTIYTIGYGDITAVNKLERVYLCIFMFVGILLYSLTVSNFSTLLTITDKKTLEYESKLNILEMIENDHEVSNILLKKIKRYLKNCYKNSYDERYNLLESLPNKIKNDLTFFMYKNHIKELNFFQGQPNDLILYVLPMLKYHHIKKGDTLFSVGEYIQDMYLVIRGCLVLTLSDQLDNIEICQIRTNQHFGEIFFETNEKSPFELKCKSKNTVMLVLKKNDYLSVKNVFRENMIEIMKNSYLNLERIDKKKKVIMELLKIDDNPQNIKKFMKIINREMMNNEFDNYYLNDENMLDDLDFLVKNQEKFTKILKSKVENHHNFLKKQTENERNNQEGQKMITIVEESERSISRNSKLNNISEYDKEKCERTKRKISDERSSASSEEKKTERLNKKGSEKEQIINLNENSESFKLNKVSVANTTEKNCSSFDNQGFKKNQTIKNQDINLDSQYTFKPLNRETLKQSIKNIGSCLSNQIKTYVEDKEENSEILKKLKEEENYKQKIKKLFKSKRKKPLSERNTFLISEILKNIDVDQKHLNLLQEQKDIQTKAISLLKNRTIKKRRKAKPRNRTDKSMKPILTNKVESIPNSFNNSCEGGKIESEFRNCIIINNNYINKGQLHNINCYTSPNIPLTTHPVKVHDSEESSYKDLMNILFDNKFNLKMTKAASFDIIQSVGRFECCVVCKNKLHNSLSHQRSVEFSIDTGLITNSSIRRKLHLNENSRMIKGSNYFNFKNNSEKSIKNKLRSKNFYINDDHEKSFGTSKLILKDLFFNSSDKSLINNSLRKEEIRSDKSLFKSSSRINEILNNNSDKSLLMNIQRIQNPSGRRLSRIIKKEIDTINLKESRRANYETLNLLKVDKVLRKEMKQLNQKLIDKMNFNKKMKEANKALDGLLDKIEVLYFVNKRKQD